MNIMEMGFREDQSIRINNKQCRGFILKENKILLMHRIKNGEEYYVFPGGHMEMGESADNTLKREILEETGVYITNIVKAFEIIDYAKSTAKKEKIEFEYYFTCTWVSGEPHLVGEELRRSSKLNYFNPIWIELGNISKLPIYSLAAKEWVMRSIIKN